MKPSCEDILKAMDRIDAGEWLETGPGAPPHWHAVLFDAKGC
jgi:hypothetical protein